ncbi:hypothetical protein ACVIHI_008389 [Bradyrhizobium sp. USDA 4524]
MSRCLIGMEACVGAHHLDRKLASLGHDARLVPAKYVRPYSKGQKNDFNDAEAIAEAVQRTTMTFVATKTAAFMLERGIAMRQGIGFLGRTCHHSYDAHRCPVTTHVALGCAGQDKELGTLRVHILDRSRQEAATPQCARNHARQQTCPHRRGCAGQRTRLRDNQDRRCRRSTRLTIAPCLARPGDVQSAVSKSDGRP